MDAMLPLALPCAICGAPLVMAAVPGPTGPRRRAYHATLEADARCERRRASGGD